MACMICTLNGTRHPKRFAGRPPDRIFAINIRGTFIVTQEALPDMSLVIAD
jgi:NAD(P)-dependent dehydrogenase (short-subunit alcohol dehydrogenase family)